MTSASSRLVGSSVASALLGGAVWIGLSSERPPPPRHVQGVEQLAQMLSERGFGCGHVDRTAPGMPRMGGADSASCEMGGKPAVLHVFQHYPSTMKSSFETGFEGGWIVGDNYVVTLHDAELAIKAADALGAEALYDPALRDS